jgi:pimeloyl-ACP methyl ester carboxylesterase
MVGARHPVLLLHGQPGGPEDWDRVVAEIAGRARTVAVSRPGWDGHSAPSGLEGNAALAFRVLERANLPRAVVVGHSLGGAVGAWMAAAHPDGVAALVLLAPAANTDALVPLDHLLAVPLLGDVLSAASMAAAGGALATAPGRRLMGAVLGVDVSELQPLSRRLLNPRSWRAFVFEQRMLLRELPSLEHRLSEIIAPTTIVAGTADRIVPRQSARRLVDQIPGAALVELTGAHHLLHHQRPTQVAEIILSAARGELPPPGLAAAARR